MKRRGAAPLILLIIIVLILIFSAVIPIMIYGTFQGGGLAKAQGGGVGGSGCFIADQYFTDTSLATNADAVVKALSEKYSAAGENERYIRETLQKGAELNINPLLPLMIWAGEQTFKSPEKAFGYGYTDSGVLEGATQWEYQLNGVYRALNQTLTNVDPYNKPAGTNRFTRLFYSYTTAMKVVYENNGNTWNEEGEYTDGSKPVKNRLAIARLLAPHQIECQTGSVYLASARSGNDGVPLYKQADFPYRYGTSTISASGCCPVSATMVLNFHGANTDPKQVADITGKFYIPGTGSSHELFKFLADRYEMKYEAIGTDWNKTLQYLKQGKPVIASGKGSAPYTDGGHCIVLTGYDERTGMVRINNPATGDGPYPLQLLKGELGNGTKTNQMYFIGK
jgi:hypothetical protein